MARQLYWPKVTASYRCHRAMDILCDKDTRKMAGVAPDKQLIFAYTGLSEHGSIG
jgi:hypothetical protein